MTWQNWAGTANADPARRVWPRSTEEIGHAIAAAARDGLTVRALGSGHSFTPAAATSGVALDLSTWTGVVGADLDSGLVTVRSGTTIRELNATLDTLGLALANLGDIDAQTVSGAISTGTHGTGARLGGIATQVAGLELVPGTQVQRYMISYQDPYLNDQPISFGLSGFYYQRIYTEWTENRRCSTTPATIHLWPPRGT